MNFEYETDRLILKVLTARAAEDVLLFQKYNRDIFEQYDGRKPEKYYTASYQRTLLNFDFNMAVCQKAFRYWLIEKEHPSKIIGTISIQRIERSIFQTCVIGYKMDRDWLRRGYMYEALDFITGLVFSDLGLHRIEAYVKPENTASIRLLEKSGFLNEGTARESIFISGTWEDHLRFALISRPERQT